MIGNITDWYTMEAVFESMKKRISFNRLTLPEAFLREYLICSVMQTVLLTFKPRYLYLLL